MTRPFRIAERIRSFRFAFRGIGVMVRTQHNAWIHTAATVTVILLGFGLEITRSDWCWIILSCMSVWTAEALNTAFEQLADVASPEFHPLVEKSKDVAAGAVLMAAAGALTVGVLVLGPYLLALW